MTPVELQEFFGATVLLQFREAVALTTTAGKEEAYMPLTPAGEPVLVQAAPDTVRVGSRKQIAPENTEPKFTLTMIAKIMPAAGDRIFVLYEHQGYVVKLGIRASDIFAVSWIEGKLDGAAASRIITS
jgi:hypothetical protein